MQWEKNTLKKDKIHVRNWETLKKKWTQEEEAELRQYFSKYLNKTVTVGCTSQDNFKKCNKKLQG